MAYICVCHFFVVPLHAKWMFMKRTVLLVLVMVWAGSMIASLPEVRLRDTDGKEVNTAHIAGQGKPVILSFFATWCKPCMRELEAINEVYDQWQEETGVEMYIVSVDQGQDTQKVKPLVNGKGWEYHVLLDPNGTFKRAMNVQNIPHLLVLDSKGTIVYTHTGYTDGDESSVRTYLH